MVAMSPRNFLIAVFIALVFFNLITVYYRKRGIARAERRLRKLSKKKKWISPRDVSRELDIPIYDAKILLKKLTAQGKVDLKKTDNETHYSFKP